MGNLPASIGKDNDELVDNLVKGRSILTKDVEHTMRLVDRGLFLPEDERDNAYKDSAWRSDEGSPGFLHLSAPCIYANVLENLDVKKGMTFLNVGSGTGYLSSMVGYLLGSKGQNHGVELYENIVRYADEKTTKINQSPESAAFDWCQPQFLVGNAFQIRSNMPRLHRVLRRSETEFTTRDISSVSFSRLIPVNPNNPLVNRPIEIPPFNARSLAEITRTVIREEIRKSTKTVVPLEFTSHFDKKKQLERNDRKRRNTNNSSTSDTARPRRQRRRTRSPESLIIFQIHRNRENQNEEADNRQNLAENEANENPMRVFQRHALARQLFNIFERRITRHLEARANQAAGLGIQAFIEEHNDDEEEDHEHEEEHEEMEQHPRENGANGAAIVEPEDTFRFHFVSETGQDQDELDPYFQQSENEDENEQDEVQEEHGENDALDVVATNSNEETVNENHPSDVDVVPTSSSSHGAEQVPNSENHNSSNDNDEEEEEEMHTADEYDEDGESDEDMVTAREDDEVSEKSTEKEKQPKKENEFKKQLKNFNEEFIRRLNTLPVNAQMHKFLKYEI